MNALLFLAVRRCGIALPWSLSIGCRVWFCRTSETSVLVPHLVVELLWLSGLRGALLCSHRCRFFPGGLTSKAHLFRLGMEAPLWRERYLFRLVRRSRTACYFCGGVCEAAGSIAFGFCGFVLCLERVFSLLESRFATGSFRILKKGHISCACRAFFLRSRSAETHVFPGRVQGWRHML